MPSSPGIIQAPLPPKSIHSRYMTYRITRNPDRAVSRKDRDGRLNIWIRRCKQRAGASVLVLGQLSRKFRILPGPGLTSLYLIITNGGRSLLWAFEPICTHGAVDRALLLVIGVCGITELLSMSFNLTGGWHGSSFVSECCNGAAAGRSSGHPELRVQRYVRDRFGHPAVCRWW